MPHPEPERCTNAPPGPERLLAGLTPEHAKAVTYGLRLHAEPRNDRAV
jgi:hypothetical protein